jgi:Xaa-Pro dipeptidase
MQTRFYLGGEMAHVITPYVASGEHMSPPHRICTDKIVRNGDLCFIDIGAMWNGYFADIGRTAIVGRPTAMQRRIYTAVYEGLMAGVAQMRPGRTNQDVADAVIGKIGEHGSATACSAYSSDTGSGWARTSRRSSARRCRARPSRS